MEELRDTGEIIPALYRIGDTEYRGEAILHDGHHWLVLKWSAVRSEGWMQPVRLICLAELAYVTTVDPLVLHVAEELPADAMPPLDPLETAKRTLVVDYPDIRFRVYMKQ